MMVRNSNADQAVPVESSESVADQLASNAESAICYRMEPAKQMLSETGHAQACRFPCDENGHHDGSPPCLLSDQVHTVVDLEKARRIALMVTPQASGRITDQAWEAISTIRAILKQQTDAMSVTSQTVFLRHADDAEVCRKLFEAYFGDRMPATNYVVQPPCGGQALAIEAWAIGGKHAEIQFLQPDVVSVAYDGLRWVHAGATAPSTPENAYAQSKKTFDETARRLGLAGAEFNDVVRVWLYVGGITESGDGTERYRELNRARTDFFAEQEANGRMVVHREGSAFYPASTGIGMAGRGFAMSCLALQTQRDDVKLLSLENPRQTSAYHYSREFSEKSPKFSRAMAVVIGDYVTTWISGTASIVNSETVHLGDVEKQTEQTIDNIQNLMSRENFERHGVSGAGAQLRDMAKVRVYVKRPEDYEKSRAICDRRFGPVPIIYAQADVCRSNLLVEIEGVAFSQCGPRMTS